MITINVTPATAPNPLVHYCVSLLERMYLQWANRHNYKWSLEAKLPERKGIGPQNMPSYPNEDGVGGLLWSIIHIDAPDGSLDNEIGIHALRLISPYDSQGRVHTTFVYVEIQGSRINPQGATRHYDFIHNRAVHYLNPEDVAFNLESVLAGYFDDPKRIGN